ncbi:hypothetical protein OG552_33240 [Streptomyces sp. NBC_01476]|uniref:hypothetical protein n=1 Tax=Streptomyces sp. NBC_01476 TaxID=2903881 RepID=UPI002E355807|nr:hypothetical protein [Streptomyces sp. NBC_01476]
MSHIAGDQWVPQRREEPLQRLLFGGVYGTVLASALAAALDQDGSGPSNPGYDALWVLVASLAGAASHGYAHAIAHRTAGEQRVTARTVRSVLTEWPLVAAAVPTLAALLGAAAGWWSEVGGINVALGINTAALFGWGLWAARVAGLAWPAACRVGSMDVLLGLFIVAANILSH